MSKPITLATQSRIRARQDKALDAILHARELEGRGECVFEDFGGPKLDVLATQRNYDNQLSGLVGKWQITDEPVGWWRRFLRRLRGL